MKRLAVGVVAALVGSAIALAVIPRPIATGRLFGPGPLALPGSYMTLMLQHHADGMRSSSGELGFRVRGGQRVAIYKREYGMALVTTEAGETGWISESMIEDWRAP